MTRTTNKPRRSKTSPTLATDAQISAALDKAMSKLNVSKKEKRNSSKGNLSTIRSSNSYFTAISSPFSQTSLGAKVADFDGNPSYTVASKDAFTVTADASGNAAGTLMFLSPNARNFGSASIISGAVTIAGGSANAWSDFTGLLSTTNAVSQRVVAGGFKIQNLLSLSGTNAAQGRLIIAPVSNDYIASLYSSGTYTESTMRKLPGCKIIPLAALAATAEPVTGITGPLDPTAFTYGVPNLTLTTTADTPNLISYIYLVVGAPASSTFMEVEMTAHWEVIPQLTYADLATSGVQASTSTMDKVTNYLQSIDLVQFSNTAQRLYSMMNGAPRRLTLTN